MDRLREELLAGAGLAEDEHAGIVLRRAMCDPLDSLDLLAGPDELREAVASAPRFRELPPGPFQLGGERFELGDQRMQPIEPVVQNESDGSCGAAFGVRQWDARD